MSEMNWVEMIWTFLNSEVGITLVGSILVIIIGKVFTAKPTWKKYADKYRPLLISAVKKAEKEIPNDTENKAKARLDWALKLVLEVNEKLDKEALAQALSAVHADAEKDGNL